MLARASAFETVIPSGNDENLSNTQKVILEVYTVIIIIACVLMLNIHRCWEPLPARILFLEVVQFS